MTHNIALDGRYIFGKLYMDRICPCYRNDGPAFVDPSGYETYEVFCDGKTRKASIFANGSVTFPHRATLNHRNEKPA